MLCPRDSIETRKTTLQGAEVELCERCGGMFLEHGELNRVAGPTDGDLEFSTVDLDTFQHDDGRGPMVCPRDGVAMRKVEFNIETGIILDYCETCQGFWVDGRELARINEEVKQLNDASREVDNPLMVRLGQFFWGLPFPK